MHLGSSVKKAETIADIIHRKQEELKGLQSAPNSIPKSGRFWKRERTKFTSIIKKPKNWWSQSKLNMEERRLVQAENKSLKDAVKKKKEERHQRHKENLERRKANEEKAEIYQFINNPTMLKRMKKKQLKKLVKRDPDRVDAKPIIYDSE
ncbi:hypothetical protein GJ496_010732 [Pomphorhynchus laevis]|nr:hypothetical protein GJ496_010732 [Pomphorhynchus laevis]